MSILNDITEIEDKLINIRQKHWALELALEYIRQAYQELRDVGI